jgi:cytochrome c5
MMFTNVPIGKRALQKLAWSFLLLACSAAGQEDGAATAEGKALYQAACSPCHALAPIERTRDGRQGWKDTVQKMVVIGTQLDAEEMDLVIDYLYAQFGPGRGEPMRTGLLPPDSPLPAAGAVSSEHVTLPAGDGQQLVQGLCTMCHDLGYIVATRRSRDDWQRYTVNMLRQNGISISADKQELLVSYLDRHFGTTGPD